MEERTKNTNYITASKPTFVTQPWIRLWPLVRKAEIDYDRAIPCAAGHIDIQFSFSLWFWNWGKSMTSSRTFN